MKKNLLSVLLLIPFWMKAQVYHPLVDSGATWNEEGGWCGAYNGILYCDAYGTEYSLTRDTVIKGDTFKLLFSRPTYYYHSESGIPLSGSNSTALPSAVGALREDSLKRIWGLFFTPGCPSLNCGFFFPPDSEVLLYNFNVDIGDTLFWTYEQDVVIGKDAIQLLDGSWRMRYELQGFLSHIYWIEGIGSTGGLFEPFMAYFENFSLLNCYKNDSSFLYEAISTNPLYLSCDLINSAIGLNSSGVSLEIIPNPSTDLISINFSSPKFSSAQIKVVDVFGRNRFTKEIESNKSLPISTQEFSEDNMLFCELWQDGKRIAVKKVLIAR